MVFTEFLSTHESKVPALIWISFLREKRPRPPIGAHVRRHQMRYAEGGMIVPTIAAARSSVAERGKSATIIRPTLTLLATATRL
jgi:hypothetical protein